MRGSHGEALTWSKPLTLFVLPWCLPREESPCGIQNFPHPHRPVQKASGRASPSHVPYSTGRDGDDPLRQLSPSGAGPGTEQAPPHACQTINKWMARRRVAPGPISTSLSWFRLMVLRIPGWGAELREGNSAFTCLCNGFHVGLRAKRKWENLCTQ